MANLTSLIFAILTVWLIGYVMGLLDARRIYRRIGEDQP